MATRKAKARKTIPSRSTPESSSLSRKKAKETAKIAELQQALIDAGISTLDDQAVALGIWRSTAWTILRRKRKAASGLSAPTIKRMWRSPSLPALARRVIREYVDQKCAGEFGHRKSRLRSFRAQLGNTLRE